MKNCQKLISNENVSNYYFFKKKIQHSLLFIAGWLIIFIWSMTRICIVFKSLSMRIDYIFNYRVLQSRA